MLISNEDNSDVFVIFGEKWKFELKSYWGNFWTDFFINPNRLLINNMNDVISASVQMQAENSYTFDKIQSPNNLNDEHQ